MNFRLGLLNVAVFGAVILLVGKLFYIQLREGEKYAQDLKRQTTVSVLLSPARGGIFDRNGIGLAENRASLDVDVYLRELVGHYSRSQKGVLPKLPYRNRELVDVKTILDQSTGEVLRNLALPVRYSTEDLLRHYDQKPNIPFQLANNLDFATLSRFAEYSINIPGVQETARPVRHYSFGALAPHILGYVGAVEEQEQGIFIESVGKEGLEKSFDSYLQGTPGQKVLRKNNVGYILGVESVSVPKVGSSVYLSLDAHIQHIAEQAMRNQGVGRGSCVIMDVETGDILAMVSVPNYDPNVFIPSVDATSWRQLTSDPTGPLHHRALASYNPGSTFKTLVSIAALTNPKAKFTPSTVINSPSAIFRANRWWNDWYAPGRGNISLFTAMQWSCNTFYYQLGLRTGIESITTTADSLGFGKRLLVDDNGNPLMKGEDPGIIPGPAWMDAQENRRFAYWKKRKQEDPTFKIPRTWRERWSEGHTINTSIGQGFTQVSALQLTTMMVAVANGGNIYYPRLVRAVRTHHASGEDEITEFPVRLKGRLNLNPAHLKVLRDSLRAVVTSGTAQRANFPEYAMAGKTGTAQAWAVVNGQRVKDNRALFNGYGPYENPKYAVTVIIEGGTSGGRDTGPVIKEIFSKIAELEKGTSHDLVYLTPAIGHFRGVQAEEVSTDPDVAPPPLEFEPIPDTPSAPAAPVRRGFWQRVFGD
ncbi:MAG: penicillin-binding protein 2 [Candidatus Methylacidiphilales bacterium]